VVRELEERPVHIRADWVKRDFERFRAPGTPGYEHRAPQPFSDANRDADARGFAALMRHVKEVDGRSTRSS